MTVGWGARRQDQSPQPGRHRALESTIPADPASPDSATPSEPPPDLFAPSTIADRPPQPGLASWQASKVGEILGRVDGHHPRSAVNGRDLAGYLREDSPWISDTGLAVVLLSWLDYAGKLDDGVHGPEVVLRAMTEAAERAVLDLTAAGRSQLGGV